MKNTCHSFIFVLAAALVAGPGLAMPKESFDRSKPHINIGTIGHVDHGKTTLAAALGKVLEEDGFPVFPLNPQIGNSRSSEQGEQGVVRNACSVDYETERRIYSHVDCPGHYDPVRSMISGEPPLDGAILLVSAPAGVTEPVREHVLLAGRIDLPPPVVFLDRADEVDPRTLDLVELEIQELLARSHGGGTTIVVRGDLEAAHEGDAAARDAMRELVEALDILIPTPEPLSEQAFLMPVEDVFSITGRGTVATGRVERGTASPGDDVELVEGGSLTPRRAVIEEIVRPFREILDASERGGNVGVLLRGVDRDEVERGMVLARPGTITPHGRFRAEVYALRKEEGGRHTPFFNKYRPQLFWWTTETSAELEFDAGTTGIFPGEHDEIGIRLPEAQPLERGLRFSIREPGTRRLVGQGIVTELDR